VPQTEAGNGGPAFPKYFIYIPHLSPQFVYCTATFHFINIGKIGSQIKHRDRFRIYPGFFFLRLTGKNKNENDTADPPEGTIHNEKARLTFLSSFQ
jgi:hypothetical protein